MGNGAKANADNSTAFGTIAKASAGGSIALGVSCEAKGYNSVSIGPNSETNGGYSIAMGFSALTTGNYSVAIGDNTITKARGAVALGSFNTAGDNPDPNVRQPTDRLFQIGRGTAANDRLNAMTILRNGNTGIGSTVLTPEYLLDIGGRPRIRHNGQTAGIHFNTSNNDPDGFVGMKTNDEVGFYLGSWNFWVNRQGNGYLGGNIIQTSDQRLKTNVTSIHHSLSKVIGLQAHHYNWKDATRDQSLQTGLIAQEVEKLFPELVTTDKEGFKAVNYIGLIPHLIESVKELKDQNEEIAVLRKQVAELSNFSKRFEAMEASLKKDANATHATSK
jgi:hypothetical protein